LITGQNPQSSVKTAKLCLDALKLSGKKVVIVATSADKMGDHTTGAWSEEITGPFYVFKDAGCDVEIYSVKGGKIPIDAGSLSGDFKTENDKRFEAGGDIAKLDGTKPIKDIDIKALDCLFLAGGHGTVVDFPEACQTWSRKPMLLARLWLLFAMDQQLCTMLRMGTRLWSRAKRCVVSAIKRRRWLASRTRSLAPLRENSRSLEASTPLGNLGPKLLWQMDA